MKLREPVAHPCLSGGGEMGALMRAKDWAATRLGPVERWPASLRTIVGTLLASSIPMIAFWGRDYIQLYNDGYIPVYGKSKHPQALGERGAVSWAEVWDYVGPSFDEVMSSGITTSDTDRLFLIDRRGFLEESYFTFSYSPIRDESGGVGGVLCTSVETTHRVIGERRLQTLKALAALPAQRADIFSAAEGAVAALSGNPQDFGFVALYLVDEGSAQFRLVPACVELADRAGLPTQFDLEAEGAALPLPFARAAREGRLQIADAAPDLAALPAGAWDVPARRIAVAPIVLPGPRACAGFLVCGLSPRLALDENYRGFLDTTVASLVAALSHAHAYEQEQRRARELEELDRVKTEFFSNVSHEFRTPLTLMLGPAEAMLTEQAQLLPAAVHRQIDTVYRNARRLLKLVNALLDFSRIEAGRTQGQFQRTDLALLTAELASMFRSAIERVGLQLEVDCPPLAEPVYVDREMWEKIVLNLLSNALKFTFEGRIRISLALAGGDAVLAVSDSGVGIPAEELPRVFERFHRVRGSRTRTHEGSGIGLALVAELARLHGGRAEVESQVDAGTTVRVSVPVGRAHLPPAQVREQAEPAALTHGPAFVEEAMRWLPDGSAQDRPGVMAEDLPAAQAQAGTKAGRVLVADDNADLREYLRQLLAPRYHVELAADGDSALERAAVNPPDLIVADVMMPGLDGFALLRALRFNPATRSIPVILLSARAGEESRIEGIAAGADDYLVKPFSARELLARIDARLEVWRLRRDNDLREAALNRQIRQSKARVDEILASINDAFSVYDAEWRYTYINDAALRMSGRRREELLGKVIWDCYPKLCGTPFEQALREAAATREPSRFEFCYEPSGRWFDVRVNVVAEGVSVLGTEITEAKQAEQGLSQARAELERRVAERTAELAQTNASLLQEVAERRRVEQALRVSEARFRTAFADAAVGMAITDRAGRLLLVNPAFARLTGRDATDLHTLDLLALTHPDDRSALIGQLRRLLAGENPSFILEKRYLRPDGKTAWVQDSVALVRDDAGDPANLIVLSQDITDRKRAERLLQASREQFRQLTELSSDWYWEQDAEYRGTYLSAGFEKVTGFPAETVLGRTRWDLPVFGVEAAAWEAHRRCLARHEPFFDFELGMRMPDGTQRWFRVSGVPVFGENEVFAGYRGVGMDITERRMAETRAQALAELSLLALRERGLEQVFLRAVELVSEGLQVELTKILELQPDGQQLKLIAGVGWREGLVGEAMVPADMSSQAGYTLYADAMAARDARGKRQPVVVENLREETRFRGPSLLLEHGVASGASVIIVGEAGAFGVLGAHSRMPRRFQQADLDFLQAVANVISAAIVYRRTQATLEERQRLLQGVLDALPIGVWIADKAGSIVQGNPAGRRIWAGERYVGIDQYGEYKGWWSGTDRLIQPHEWALARAIEHGETSIDELVDIECFDGSRRTILNSAVPLRDESGGISGAIVVNEDVTQRRLVEETVANIAAGMSALTGEPFFQRLVERLAATLAADCGFIGEVTGGSEGRMRLLAWHGSEPLAAGFEYALADTPCENVVAQGLCVYPDGVAETFPQDKWLTEMGARSYAGTPLRDSAGEVLGILTVISRKPLAHPEITGGVLNILAARATAELERLHNDATIRLLLQASELLHAVTDLATLSRRLAEVAAEVCGAPRAACALLRADGRFSAEGEVVNGRWKRSLRDWDAASLRQRSKRAHVRTGRGDGHGDEAVLPLKSSAGDLLGAVELAGLIDGWQGRHIVRERLTGVLRIGAIAAEKALFLDRVQRAEQSVRESEVRLRALAARLQGLMEQERTRIAREIHDVLGQSLTGLKLDIAWLKREVPAGSSRALEQIDAICRSLDGIVQTVRRISSDMRPGELDDLGLVAAIESAAQEFQARSGIRCRARLPDQNLAINPDAATAVFRIGQELLTNVARHARATRVDLSLEVDGGDVVLTVADDGRGLRPEQAASRKALGLMGIRERARMFGGSASFEGAPGAGTRATVRLPLHSAGLPVEKSASDARENYGGQTE